VKPLSIDHMTLELPGPVDRGRNMAVEIATLLAAAGALPAAGDYPAIPIEVRAEPNQGEADLTARIVAEALRQLQRGIG
jgi:hypothetical protein